MPAKKKAAAQKPSAIIDGLLIPERISPLVHLLRHEKVILDSDLAKLYGVETGHLNRAVQRNLDRFPADFMFQVTEDEMEILISQIARSSHPASNLKSQIVTSKNAEPNLKCQIGISSSHGGRRTLPYVFTEQGVAMLSSVLRSPRAVEVNIAIMRTFIRLRRLMDSNALLAEKIEALEAKYAEHDQHFEIVFEAIKQLIATPTAPAREMGFHTLPNTKPPRKLPKPGKNKP